jgi:hypothetical protein
MENSRNERLMSGWSLALNFSRNDPGMCDLVFDFMNAQALM